MSPYSDARRRRDRHYQQQRQAAYTRSGGRCEAMTLGCTGRAEQIHHVAGRGGDDPHRLENLKALCSHCHTWTHQNVEAATRLGLMKSRLRQVRPASWAQEDTT